MFNKKKAGDLKYCTKKIEKDINNLKYVDINVIEELFGSKFEREWSYDFMVKASNDERIINAIRQLPLNLQRPIVKNLVSWNGTLLNKFDASFMNDPDIAMIAIGPDLVLDMPTTKKYRYNHLGEDYYTDVYDYDALKNHYDMFSILGEEAKVRIFRMLADTVKYGNGINRDLETLAGLKPEQIYHLLEYMPDKVKADKEIAIDICRKYPEAYQYFNEDVKKDIEVINQVIHSNNPNVVKDVIKKLSKEEKNEIIKDYRVGWYSSKIPSALSFMFENQENLKLLLEGNELNETILTEIDPEILKDEKFAKYCISKLNLNYENGNVEGYLNKFSKSIFKDAETVVNLLNGVKGQPDEVPYFTEILNNLTPQEYAKVVTARPETILLETKHDRNKVMMKAIKGLDKRDVGEFYNSVKDKFELTREAMIQLYALNPEKMHYYINEMDMDFYVEASLLNEDVISTIKNQELRNDVVIARTALKYLNTKFPKIKNESDLDKLVETVKKAKSKGKSTTKKEATKTASTASSKKKK